MNRMLRAIFKKYFKLLMSITIVVSLGFTLVSGLTSGYLTLEESLYHYVSAYDYPDIMITTEVTSAADADAIRALDHVKIVDTRLCGDTIMKNDDGNFYSVRVFTYSGDEQQDFCLKSTSGNTKEGVFLEYKFANSNHIEAGDTVYLHVQDEYREYKVTGIVTRPETLWAKISDNAWGLNYDFGYVYAPVEFLQEEYAKDYKENKGELDKEAVNLQNEKDSAQKLLADKEKELNDAKELLAAKTAEFNSSQQQAQETAATLTATRANLVASQQELESQQSQLESAGSSIESQRSELQSQYSQLSQAKSALSELDSSIAQLERSKAAMSSGGASSVVSQLSALPADTPITVAMGQIEYPDDPDEYGITEDDISGAYDEYVSGGIDVSALEAALAGYNGASIYSMTAGQAVATYYSAQSDLDSQLSSLYSQRASVVSQLNANGVDESSIDSSMQQIQDGLAECDSAEAQLESTRTELSNGIAEVKSGIEEIDSALSTIESQLSEGKSQLSAAEEEIAAGDAQLKDAAGQMKEFTRLDDELVKAYRKLNDGEGYDKLCNQFMIYLDEGADPDSVLSQALRTFDGIKFKSSYTFEDSPVNSRIDMNLDPISTLMVVLPIPYFGVIMIVVFLFISMIINQSRREIGILRALGFSKGSIRWLFCKVGLVVAFFGCLIGCGLGLLLRAYVGEYFADLLVLPEVIYQINWYGFVIAAAAAVVVCISATLLSTIMISRVQPKEAMSRPVSSNARISAFGEMLTRKASPMFKMNVISVLRHKARFFFATICIAASVMLIFASLSFIASKNYLITQTFDERIFYDCQVFFEEPPTKELIADIEKIDGVDKVEQMLMYDVTITFDGRSQSADVNAISEDNTELGIFDPSGNNLAVKDGEIIMEKHTAEPLGVKAGDSVLVNGVKLKVSAITDQCANRMQFVTFKDGAKFGKPELSCALCSFDGDARKNLLGYLTDTDVYLYSVFTKAFLTYNKELYATYDLAAWILIGFAIVIGFVIVFNTTMTDLEDNKRELCVLRTLGFQRSEISRSRFLRSMVQFVIAFVLGVIPGFILADITLKEISTDIEDFLFASGVPEWLFTAGLVFAYILLTHFFSMNAMKKWNAAEVVKEKE